jgi:hypothetical protein
MSDRPTCQIDELRRILKSNPHALAMSDIWAPILELDERLKRVEAFIGTETEEEFLAFIRSLPKPKMPSANPYSKPESDK